MITKYHQRALEIAHVLHWRRQHYVNELAQLITDSMHAFPIPRGQFTIDAEFGGHRLGADDADRIEFRVIINPGQPMQSTAKIASGGELSRVVLAIQVITARKMETPALISDEVDVGTNGPTAVVVGKLLCQPGESARVIHVTHLPQVTRCGHQHYFVNEKANGTMAETYMRSLDKGTRPQEPAHLFGDSEVTCDTLANAGELLVT